MESAEIEDPSSKKRKHAAPETGPFVLRTLLEDLPLSAEGNGDGIEINCVEFLGMHNAAGLSSLQNARVVKVQS
jgi:hypothetical protein